MDLSSLLWLGSGRTGFSIHFADSSDEGACRVARQAAHCHSGNPLRTLVLNDLKALDSFRGLAYELTLYLEDHGLAELDYELVNVLKEALQCGGVFRIHVSSAQSSRTFLDTVEEACLLGGLDVAQGGWLSKCADVVEYECCCTELARVTKPSEKSPQSNKGLAPAQGPGSELIASLRNLAEGAKLANFVSTPSGKVELSSSKGEEGSASGDDESTAAGSENDYFPPVRRTVYRSLDQAVLDAEKRKTEQDLAREQARKIAKLAGDSSSAADNKPKNTGALGALLKKAGVEVEKKEKVVDEKPKEKKACANCSCGKAELEKTMTQEEIRLKMIKGEIESKCGSCFLGDDFRCEGCPFRGMPAFEPGEEKKLILKTDANKTTALEGFTEKGNVAAATSAGGPVKLSMD